MIGFWRRWFPPHHQGGRGRSQPARLRCRFGAGLVAITLELVSVMRPAAAADGRESRPAVVRGLVEAEPFRFFGAGSDFRCLALSCAGLATLRSPTGASRKWTGRGSRTARRSPISRLLHRSKWGPDDRGSRIATGDVTMIGQGLLAIWFAVASVSMMVVKPATGASNPATGSLEEDARPTQNGADAPGRPCDRRRLARGLFARAVRPSRGHKQSWTRRGRSAGARGSGSVALVVGAVGGVLERGWRTVSDLGGGDLHRHLEDGHPGADGIRP